MRQRKTILLVVAGLCGLASIYLCYFIGILSIYILVALSALTILLPLVSGLYIYKGKAMRFWLSLTVFAILCGIVFTVDVTATQATFRTICDGMGPEYQAASYGIDGDYVCSAGYEVDPQAFRTSTVSSVMGPLLFWPCLLVLFMNVLHVPYIAWRLGRIYISKHRYL